MIKENTFTELIYAKDGDIVNFTLSHKKHKHSVTVNTKGRDMEINLNKSGFVFTL